MYNLFALTDEPGSRILKFILSQDVQKEITDYFQKLEKEFDSQCQTEILFDGKYKPDPSEVLIINDFDDIDDISSAITNPLSVNDIYPNQINSLKIKSLFVGYVDNTGNCIALLQKFSRNKIISPHGISIFFSGDVYKKLDGTGVTLDESISVKLTGNTIKFFSFHEAKRIFDLSNFYKEATDGDIDSFSSSLCFSQSSHDIISIADSWIRRKISFIIQSGVLSTPHATVENIVSKALKFKITLATENENGQDKIVIPSNKNELKKLLRFLDDDYYDAILSTDQFISNSKCKVH